MATDLGLMVEIICEISLHYTYAFLLATADIMSSADETSYSDDESPSWSAGGSCKFYDPSWVKTVIRDVISGCNNDSHPQFSQNYENDPVLSRDIPPLSDQPLGSYRNYDSQQGMVSNVPEICHALYHQSPENISSAVQETQLIPDQWSEYQFNEDASPQIPSAIELNGRQNIRQGFYAQRPSAVDDSHPQTIQSSDTYPNPKQQLLPERKDFFEHGCKAIQERHAQTELDVFEYSATENSYPSSNLLYENDVNQSKQCDYQAHQKSVNEKVIHHDSCLSANLPQGCNSQTEQHYYRGEPTASQGLYPLSCKPYQITSNRGQTVLSVSHDIFENEMNRIQEYDMLSHQQSASQYSSISPHQSTSNIGRTPSRDILKNELSSIQNHNLQTQKQYSVKPSVFQRSYSFCHQPHQSRSNIGQSVLSVSHDIFKSELIASRETNTLSSFQNVEACNNILDLTLQSFQQSKDKSEDVQSSYPLTHWLSERDPLIKRSSEQLASGIIQTTKHFSNQSIDNQDVQPRQTYTKNETRDQDLHLFLQEIAQNLKKRQPSESPPHQLCKRGPGMFPHTTGSQPITSYTSDPLPSHSSEKSRPAMEKQSKSDEMSESTIGTEDVDLSLLQHPYSNNSTFVNVLVYGAREWTSLLLQTYSGEHPLRYASPYSFLFQRNVTRSGVLMTLSMYQMDDLYDSLIFLRSTCASYQSTIILMDDAIEWMDLYTTLDPLINLIRTEISRTVSVILVVGRTGKRIPEKELDEENRKKRIDFRRMGFRLKARYGLASFFVCYVESMEEVNAVMYTAMDVSFLSTR